MAADIEWVGVHLEGATHEELKEACWALGGGKPLGVLRAGREYTTYENADPYESACLVTDNDHTAHLWFAHNSPQKVWKQFRKTLVDFGFNFVEWSRPSSKMTRHTKRRIS